MNKLGSGVIFGNKSDGKGAVMMSSLAEALGKDSFMYNAKVLVKDHNSDFRYETIHNRKELCGLLQRGNLEAGVIKSVDMDKIETAKICLANNISVFYDRNVTSVGENCFVSGWVESLTSKRCWAGTAIFMVDDGVAPIDMTEELLEFVKSITTG